MLFCTDSFVLSLLEGIKMGYYVGCFDGNGDDMGGTFLGIVVGGIVTSSEIYAIQFNDSSHFFCKSEM